MRRCWHFICCRTGTAIADFSEALRGHTFGNSKRADGGGLDRENAGSERAKGAAAEDSHSWQEVETLAGHLDLTQAFLVNANAGSGRKLRQRQGPAAAAPALTPTAARSN